MTPSRARGRVYELELAESVRFMEAIDGVAEETWGPGTAKRPCVVSHPLAVGFSRSW